MAPKAILYLPCAHTHNSYTFVYARTHTTHMHSCMRAHTHTPIKIWRVSENLRGWFVCEYGMDYGDDFKNI